MTPEKLPEPAAQDGLFLLMARFSGEGQALARLFQECPSFQSLCQDYQECWIALQKWQQSCAEEASGWRRAYAQLLRELEQEVRQYLDNPAASRPAPA